MHRVCPLPKVLANIPQELVALVKYGIIKNLPFGDHADQYGLDNNWRVRKPN